MRADVPCVSEDLLRCDYVVLISPRSTSLFRLCWAIKYLKSQQRPPLITSGSARGLFPSSQAPLSNPLNQVLSRVHLDCQKKHSLPLICISLPAVPAPAPEPLAPFRPDVLPHTPSRISQPSAGLQGVAEGPVTLHRFSARMYIQVPNA